MYFMFWGNMGRKSKDLSDYKKLATENDLEFMEDNSPRYTTDQAKWRCKICERVFFKSYHGIAREDGRACYCRSGLSLKEEDYRNAALTQGLEWRGKRMPQNVEEETEWYSRITKSKFRASYAQLFYKESVPERFAAYVSR